MQLIEIKEITATIVLESGLHIGAGNDEIKIGGIDNSVVKNPITRHPYIPGSSLKGKVRTLLEWSSGEIRDRDKPFKTDESDNLIARIFGNGDIVKDYKGGPTRVSFKDCNLNHENMRELVEKMSLTEEKTEISMNRLSGTAADGGLRTMERVPAGAKFDFGVTFKIFDMGDGGKRDLEAYELLKQGLKMLELDSLGGSGSRGYGKIKFNDLKEMTAWQSTKGA